MIFIKILPTFANIANEEENARKITFFSRYFLAGLTNL